MTNELGTTLSDIEAKAERKREALRKLNFLYCTSKLPDDVALHDYNLIRKYIEEN